MSGKGQRVLRVFKALEAHPLIGLSNKEIADGLGLTATQVSRDLDDLIAEGLAVKLDNGNFETFAKKPFLRQPKPKNRFSAVSAPNHS